MQPVGCPANDIYRAATRGVGDAAPYKYTAGVICPQAFGGVRSPRPTHNL